MPVTFTVVQHPANPVAPPRSSMHSTETLLKYACLQQGAMCAEMLQSSANGEDFAALSPLKNGFVGTVMEAYVKHHHLIIRLRISDFIVVFLTTQHAHDCIYRPDDVWIAILAQFSF